MNKYWQINGSPVKKPQTVIRNREEEAHDALTWAQDTQLWLDQDHSGNYNEYCFETQTPFQTIYDWQGGGINKILWSHGSSRFRRVAMDTIVIQ